MFGLDQIVISRLKDTHEPTFCNARLGCLTLSASTQHNQFRPAGFAPHPLCGQHH
ncbi:hypothetical protein SynBIOSU31_01813 [Synechococcus sp. BIOS-U3-1]|nr:hypothetical protein SynBIOSU31_01813 [Synechococcus sp. BIOS-U3-1]